MQATLTSQTLCISPTWLQHVCFVVSTSALRVCARSSQLVVRILCFNRLLTKNRRLKTIFHHCAECSDSLALLCVQVYHYRRLIWSVIFVHDRGVHVERRSNETHTMLVVFVATGPDTGTTMFPHGSLQCWAKLVREHNICPATLLGDSRRRHLPRIVMRIALRIGIAIDAQTRQGQQHTVVIQDRGWQTLAITNREECGIVVAAN